MVTKNPRLNITLDEILMGVLQAVAERESKSVSRVARELIVEAVNRREDHYLSDIATKRDVKNMKYISHEDAWK